MKSLIFLAVTVTLVVQATNGLPRPSLSTIRIRRDTLRLPRSATHAKDDEPSKHDEVMAFAIGELFNFVNSTVQSHKIFFKDVIVEAEKSELNLNSELREMRDFIKKVDELKDYEDEKLFKKTFELFEKSTEITDKYDLDDDTKELTERQKAMGKIFEQKGFRFVQLELLGHLSGMRSRFRTHIQNYLNSLTPEEKREEEKIVNWFEKFETETDFEKNVEILMQFFELLED